MAKKETYLYKISLATQIGKKSGKLLLSVEKDIITGFLEILGTKQIINGEYNENMCILKGQLKTLVSVFEYTAIGHFDKNEISLKLSYKHGTMNLTGSCIECIIEI